MTKRKILTAFKFLRKMWFKKRAYERNGEIEIIYSLNYSSIEVYYILDVSFVSMLGLIVSVKGYRRGLFENKIFDKDKINDLRKQIEIHSNSEEQQLQDYATFIKENINLICWLLLQLLGLWILIRRLICS